MSNSLNVFGLIKDILSPKLLGETCKLTVAYATGIYSPADTYFCPPDEFKSNISSVFSSVWPPPCSEGKDCLLNTVRQSFLKSKQ